MYKRNKLVVVISIIILLTVISAMILAYLYMATDIFKSKKELFFQYFGQNIEVFEKITDSQTIKLYENLKNENQFEINTNIKLVHSEGGEISNPFNDLSAKFDIQKDAEEQYVYAKGNVLFEEEPFFETEIIKQQELYGIRFPRLIKQFVSISGKEEMQDVFSLMGINEENLKAIEDLTIQIEGIEQKYLNIITKTIENGVFEKDSLNETNIYSVFINEQNVENMLIDILNNLKNEKQILEKLEAFISKEEIIKEINNQITKISEELDVPFVRITVYEEKQKTTKTEVEFGANKVIFNNVEENENITSRISYIEGQNEKYNLQINKKKIEGQENFDVSINKLGEEKENKLNLSSLVQILNNDEIKMNIELSKLEDITKIGIVIENTIKAGNDFEKVETLDAENNIVLNEIDEGSRATIVDYVEKAVQKNINEKLDMLKVELGLKNEQVEDQTEDVGEWSQVDINKFNAKFEFYIGDEVSSENVKILLDVVKNNLKNYENVNAVENADESTKEKVDVKLNIEKDTINETMVNEIIEKLGDNKKYKVLIFYKNDNNLIDYIRIIEV